MSNRQIYLADDQGGAADPAASVDVWVSVAVWLVWLKSDEVCQIEIVNAEFPMALWAVAVWYKSFASFTSITPCAKPEVKFWSL